MRDVEDLPPPPEIKDSIPSQKYKGMLVISFARDLAEAQFCFLIRVRLFSTPKPGCLSKFGLIVILG